MIETLRPTFEKGKKAIAVGTVSALAILGITGCAGDTKTVTWKLQATCPDENERPEIRNVQTRGAFGSFEIACGDGAPLSVELTDGPDMTEAENTEHNIEVVVNDASGGFLGPKSGSLSYTSTDIRKGVTSVGFKNVDDIVRVAAIDQK